MSRARAVFIRLDKIGDLVQTMACDELLPQDIDLKWIISSRVTFVAEHAVPQRSYIALNLENPWKAFFSLLKFLRSHQPQLSVIFYAPFWAYLACFLVGVPLRSGRRSSWASFLFLNRGLRQRRHLSEKQEAQYNWEIVAHSVGRPLHELPPAPFLKLGVPFRPELFTQWNLTAQNYFVCHPGMAGSALNWPEEQFCQLLEKIIAVAKVVITGTSADEPFLIKIKERFSQHPQIVWTVNALGTEDLLLLLSQAKGVVAPSTGVLHLAASLGTRCIGLYSPVLSQHPQRWAPRSPQAHILVPLVNCPATQSCLRQACSQYNCMNQITVNDVMKALFS